MLRGELCCADASKAVPLPPRRVLPVAGLTLLRLGVLRFDPRKTLSVVAQRVTSGDKRGV